MTPLAWLCQPVRTDALALEQDGAAEVAASLPDGPGPERKLSGPSNAVVERWLQPAHVPVWNPPCQPHLTLVGREPFLCFFVWARDVAALARVNPAPDWAKQEALEIG